MLLNFNSNPLRISIMYFGTVAGQDYEQFSLVIN